MSAIHADKSGDHDATPGSGSPQRLNGGLTVNGRDGLFTADLSKTADAAS